MSAAAAAAVTVGVFATQALAVRADLSDAKAQLAEMMGEVAAGGDAALLEARVERITALTARARATVDGPLWGLFARVPEVGANVAAVRDVAQATDILVHDALPVGLELASTVDIGDLALAGGGIDLAPFAAAQSSLPVLDDAFARAHDSVRGIDRADLLPVVDESIGQVLDAIDTAAPSISLLEEYLPTLLQMAGSEGPRRYLLIFQNLAETRATGGNPAASMVLTVEGGRMSFSDQASSASFAGTEGSPYLDLPAETVGLYEDDTFAYMQNFTRTPDFPTTAALLRSAWQRTTGQDVDGVISVDPVVLSMILEVTGPVELPDGSQLTAENAVKTLLNDAYFRFTGDGAEADAYFAEVAAAAFGRIVAGGWSPADMFDRLARAAAEERVHLWFAREGEEAVALDVGVAGSLVHPSSDLELGVFVNDSGHSKLGYYLASSVSVTCDAVARTTTTSITVTSSAPTGELPYYVRNARAGRYGVAPSTMLLDILYVAPPGSTVTASDPASGDIARWDRSGIDAGRDAWSRSIALASGETRTVSFVSTIPGAAAGPVAVRHTPGIGPTPVTVDASCDALAPAPTAP